MTHFTIVLFLMFAISTEVSIFYLKVYYIRLDIPLLFPQWGHFRITAAGAH